MKPITLISAAIICAASLTACGGQDGGTGSGDQAKAGSADCPPTQKGNGIMVSSRYDYEDLLAANRWRTDMFPRTCAGRLAGLVPEMPSGYGVKPTNKPYVMTDDQVYVTYAEMPDPLYLGEDNPNIPRDMEAIEYEIVRFSDEEMATLRTWMGQNQDSILTGEINGQPVHLIGGFGSGRPGKGDRLATALHALLDDNIVVRVSHESLFSQRGGLNLSPLVQTIMGDIIARANAAG